MYVNGCVSVASVCLCVRVCVCVCECGYYVCMREGINGQMIGDMDGQISTGIKCITQEHCKGGVGCNWSPDCCRHLLNKINKNK